jgi:hypothetical protein
MGNRYFGSCPPRAGDQGQMVACRSPAATISPSPPHRARGPLRRARRARPAAACRRPARACRVFAPVDPVRRLGWVAGLGALPTPGVTWAAVPDPGARPSSTRPPRLDACATIRWSRPSPRPRRQFGAFRGALRSCPPARDRPDGARLEIEPRWCLRRARGQRRRPGPGRQAAPDRAGTRSVPGTATSSWAAPAEPIGTTGQWRGHPAATGSSTTGGPRVGDGRPRNPRAR